MQKGKDFSRSIEIMSLLAVSFFLMLVLAAPAIYDAAGAWSNCRGPEGGGVNVLAIDPKSPQTIYAGTDDGGVFKSTDAGGRFPLPDGWISNRCQGRMGASNA